MRLTTDKKAWKYFLRIGISFRGIYDSCKRAFSSGQRGTVVELSCLGKEFITVDEQLDIILSVLWVLEKCPTQRSISSGVCKRRGI